MLNKLPLFAEPIPMTSISELGDGATVARPQSLSDLFPNLGERFEASGIVGLVVIGAPMLAEVERRHGDGARQHCLESLCARVQSVAEERLRTDFLVCLAEPGFDEIMVLLFRERGSAGFYRTEMPGFRNEVNRALQADGGQVFYPYLRGPRQLPCGLAVELRNPQFGLMTQLRRLVNDARSDCRHDAEAARRNARHELLETILDHRIYSVYETDR